MWPSRAMKLSEETRCIDPRLLENHGGWVDQQDSAYPHREQRSGQKPDRTHTLGILKQPVIPDAQSARQGNSALPRFAPCEAPPTPQRGAANRLTLETPPTTPTITVKAASQATAMTRTCVTNVRPSRDRPRASSSSDGRPSPVSKRPNAATFRVASLIPTANEVLFNNPLDWIKRNPYHVGDRHPNGSATQAAPGSPSSPIVPAGLLASSPPSSQGRGPYYCDVDTCKERDTPWDTQSALKHHQRKHLSRTQRPHACNICGMRFLYPKDVRRHMLAGSHGGQPVVCYLCDKQLSRDDNLARHMASQHPATPSTASEASVASPALTTLSSFSDAAYVYHGTPSTGPSSPWLSFRSDGFSMQRMLPQMGDGDDLFAEESLDVVPDSVRMARWHTN